LILIELLFLHFFLLVISNYGDSLILILFSAVMASEKVPSIPINIDNAQLVKAFEESFLVVGSNTEDSIISEAFGKRSVSCLLIFISPLRALLLDFLFDEFAFQTRHCLLDLVLRWS
jgi:hypothetical protein